MSRLLNSITHALYITILIRSLHNWESYRHRIRKKTYCLLSIQSMVLTSNLKCQIMYVQFIMFMIQCVNMIFNRVKVIICNFSMNTRQTAGKRRLLLFDGLI